MAVVGIETERDIAGGHVKWCAIMYAFSSAIIEVTTDAQDVQVVMRFPTGRRDTSGMFDEWYTEERTARDGKVWFDASAFIRAYFADAEKMPLPSASVVQNPLYDVAYSFAVTIGGNTESVIDAVMVAWGSFGFWDSLTAERHLLWNPNLPMTVDVFATRLDAVGDYDAMQSAVNLGGTSGWLPAWRVPVSQMAVAGYPDLLMEVEAGDAFEYKDGTVTDGNTQNILFVMDFRKPDEGYYLRWLDKFGRMCYRMFSKGKRSLSVTHDNAYVRISEDYFRNNPALVGRHSEGNRIYSEVGTVETLTMGDEWIDRFELSEVMGLMKSMFVELWRDGAWYRVNVVPASFSYDLDDELHRFGLSVQMPVTNVQS